VGFRSDPADLALHGVRVLGFASEGRVAARYGLDREQVGETLLDAEAYGWASRSSFAGSGGWSLTDAGRAEDERRLSAELDRADARAHVMSAHADFLPLNDRFGRASTDWQVRPTRLDPMAANDHRDWPWDQRVLRTLTSVGAALRELTGRLGGTLGRFGPYADLYDAALRHVDGGSRAWVDAPDRDSCHLVWIQLHEDLLSTLGLQRGPGA
jgi:hypothetical protein